MESELVVRRAVFLMTYPGERTTEDQAWLDGLSPEVFDKAYNQACAEEMAEADAQDVIFSEEIY